MTSWPKRFVWQYKTQPKHSFDKTIWILLRPIMNTLAHGKISHWWHWNKVENLQLQGVMVPADPSHSFHIQGRLEYNHKKGAVGLDQVRMGLGGWKSAMVVEPDAKIEKWQYPVPITEEINPTATTLLYSYSKTSSFWAY